MSLTSEVGRSGAAGEVVSIGAKSLDPTEIAAPMIKPERTSAGLMGPTPGAGDWRSWFAGVPSPSNEGSSLDVFSFNESTS